MNYTYFVSYSHETGFGMTEIFRDTPINTFDDVVSITKTIKANNGLDVVILSWKELKS